jgi:hypothetical protein
MTYFHLTKYPTIIYQIFEFFFIDGPHSFEHELIMLKTFKKIRVRSLAS